MSMKLTYLEMPERKQSKANVPPELKKTVMDWIEREGKHLGYRNFDQFLRDAVREKYLELTSVPRTEEIREVEKITFRDLKGEIWKLMISNGQLHCDVCESVDCKHIKRLRNDKEIQEIIKGLSPDFSDF